LIQVWVKIKTFR